MGRNGGRQWGETVAAYGELSMAAVTETKLYVELLADAAAALHRDRCDFRSECRGRAHQHQ
jgi:hypothetical protein